LQLQISEWLMQNRQAYDPEPQRQILRRATFNITNDASLTEMLVPEKPVAVTDSVHDAQLSVGTLLDGLPVAVKTGMNHQEYIETYLQAMQMVIQKVEARGGVPTADVLDGLQNIAGQTTEGQPVPSGGIMQHLEILAQDPQMGEAVKQYQDALAQTMNMVKKLAARFEEQQQAQGEQDGQQLSAEDQGKIISAQILAEGKDQRAQESHQQKTIQRQVSHDLQLKQQEQKHESELRKQATQLGADLAATDAETQVEIALQKRKAAEATKTPAAE
jgi:hypothetical protein